MTTCYFEYSDDMVVRFQKAGSEVVCLSPTGTRVNGWRGILFLYKGLRRVLKQYKPDVAHVQYMAPGAIPILLLRWLGVRQIIATAHTMMIAAMAGISVFATGGIGGVHRGAETTMDISADLEELAQTPVMVVCAGAKSILDLGLTLEYLETHGVPVIGYQTEELPAFYTRKSGFKVDYRLDTPEQLAQAFHVKQELGLRGGMLVTNPIPEQYSMDADVINKAINEAVEEAKEQGIHGKATTPFLLAKIKDITGGSSLAANIQLVYNNAKLATATACELAKLKK